MHIKRRNHRKPKEIEQRRSRSRRKKVSERQRRWRIAEGKADEREEHERAEIKERVYTLREWKKSLIPTKLLTIIYYCDIKSYLFLS